MVEIRLLVDDIDYNGLADMAIPMVCEKLQKKGGIAAKLANEEKLNYKAHKIINKKSQYERDEFVVHNLTKFRTKILDVAKKVIAKKGIGITVLDISAKHL